MGKDRIGFKPTHSRRTAVLFIAALFCTGLVFIAFGLERDPVGLSEGVFEVRFDDVFASVPLAYDERTQTVYWPIQQHETARAHALSANNGAARIVLGDEFHIDYKTPQPFTVSNGKSYFNAWVQFTPLAVMDIKTDTGEAPMAGYVEGQKDIQTPCMVSVTDPNWESNGGSYSLGYGATIHPRGGTTATLPKKGYRIHFYKDRVAQKTKYHVPLLGMHSQDGWVLDPLSLDRSLLRVATGEHLWNELVESHEGPYTRNVLHGEYFELLLNGSYQGLYYLRVPIQGMTVGLDSQEGILFTDHGTGAVDLENLDLKKGKGNRYQSMSINYPTGMEDYNGYWPFAAQSIKRMLDKLYLEEGDVSDMWDVKNAADMWLFNQLLYSKDTSEHAKNVYYSKRNWKDVDERLWMTPWDIDLTMQLNFCVHDSGMLQQDHRYDGKVCTVDVTPDMILPMGLLDYLTEPECPEGREMLKSRWRQLRLGAWSNDSIMGHIEEKRALLDESGAGIRDAVRWSHETPFFHIERIESWLSQRLIALDAYIASL